MGRGKIQEIRPTQTKLFIEKIDGTLEIPKTKEEAVEKKRLGDFFVWHTVGIYSCGVDLTDRETAPTKSISLNFKKIAIQKYIEENKLDKHTSNLIMTLLFQDTFTVNMCLTLKAYRESKNRKNYIMSESLTKCMGDISLDVPKNILPENFVAYIQPKNLNDFDGTEVMGALVCIGLFAGHRQRVSVCLFTKPLEVVSEEQAQLYEYTSFAANTKHIDSLDKLEFAEGFDQLGKISSSRPFRTIINTVLYIHGGNEEFEEQYNVFSKKYKAVQTQKKIYSEKKFIRIGFENAEHLKLMVEKDVKVKPHWRMQPYGPKRMYRKPILIGEQHRSYKRYVDKETRNI